MKPVLGPGRLYRDASAEALELLNSRPAACHARSPAAPAATWRTPSHSIWEPHHSFRTTPHSRRMEDAGEESRTRSRHRREPVLTFARRPVGDGHHPRNDY